jgi:hypothetical protein
VARKTDILRINARFSRGFALSCAALRASRICALPLLLRTHATPLLLHLRLRVGVFASVAWGSFRGSK